MSTLNLRRRHCEPPESPTPWTPPVSLDLNLNPAPKWAMDFLTAADQAEMAATTGGRCPACLDGHPPPDVASRCGLKLGIAVCVLLLIVSPMAENGQLDLPIWAVAILLTCAGIFLLRQVWKNPRWGDEYPYIKRFMFWFLLLDFELLFENFMVWVVSATDKRKGTIQPALQDNLLDLLKHLSGTYPDMVQPVLEFHWTSVKYFLAALLLLAFSVAWDQVPYSGFGMMARFCAATTCCRLVRVVAFCCTVMPSPRPGCAILRFPPLPDTAWGMITQAYQQLRGGGGCNDLIISGHGVFWTMVPLMFHAYYPTKLGRFIEMVLWLALIQTSLRTVWEKYHYSVDMVLAVVVTWGVWMWSVHIYSPTYGVLPLRPPGVSADPKKPIMLLPIALGLFVALLACICQGSGTNEHLKDHF